MEIPRRVRDRDALDVELRRLRSGFESARIVVNREAVHIAQRIFQIEQTDLRHVAHGHVEERRQDLLLEEPRIETKREEHGRPQAAPADDVMKFVRKDATRDVAHATSREMFHSELMK